MISLQSHNQVLYHLTQLFSSVTPKPTPVPVKIKGQNESLDKSIDNDVSHNGHAETAENYVEVLIDRLNVHDVVTMFSMKKNRLWVILDQLPMRTSKRQLGQNSNWKVSYVSGLTFTENKQGFPCAQLTEPIILPSLYLSPKQHHRNICTHCTKNPLNYHVQTRSFKTQRNAKIEVERNPSLMSRFKKWLGQLQTANVGTSFTHNVREADIEKIRHLFGNNEVNAEEKKRIRSAFVEGYETGLQRQIRNRPIWVKWLSSLLLGTIVLTLFINAALNPGGMFRFSMGSRAEINPETIHVTFNDVKGVEEAKQELRDVVEFLINPEKFSALGGKLPKGVLLVGPPGTGKTLLARAVAGEAGVPFFHASGPEFDEVLVGQGARRVRDLFKAAKERAPAVIFIDEIDSVGAKRTNSVLHPYANQTINQLLSEMDGFRQNEGVIVLGATNRRDDLDKALMRPGRFDVEIFIQPPDFFGRKEMIDLYLSRVLARDVDIDYIARCTSGFTGAEIENMINQAALKAAIDDADYVTMKHLEYARDKVLMGPAGKLRAHTEEVNLLTAYHEAGHALVAHFTKDAVPIHKVTIIPRGPALGHTSFVHEKDVFHTTKSQLLADLDVSMGGRAAEELIFGADRVTTGAYSDFKKATTIAEQMVKLYGMSEKVGFRTHSDNKQELTLGSEYGPSTNELIDNEVKRLLQESYDRAKTILKTYAKEHKLLADALVKYETLDAQDVKAIINGKKTRTESLSNPTPIVEPVAHVL